MNADTRPPCAEDASFDFLPSSIGPYLVGVTHALIKFAQDKKLQNNLKPTKFSKREINKWVKLWIKTHVPKNIITKLYQ